MTDKATETSGLGFIHEPRPLEIKTYRSSGRYQIEIGPPFDVEQITEKEFKVSDPENSREYQIKIAFVDTWTVGLRPANPDLKPEISQVIDERGEMEKAIKVHVASSIYYRMHSELNKASEYDLIMGGDSASRDTVKEHQEEINSEIWQDSLDEAERYMSSLKENKIQLKLSKYEIGDGRRIDILDIGKINSMMVGRALQVMDEYTDTLSLPPKRHLTIVNFFDFEDRLGQELGVSYAMFGCAREMMGPAGSADRDTDTIYVSPVAQKDPDSGDPKLDLVYYYRVLRHELSHRMDRRTKNATTAQREGFARMCELRFNFEYVRNNLRRSYKNEVTAGHLIEILNFSGDGKKFVNKELYDISGSFFAYLFQKHGAEKFMTFYGLLTGALASDGEKMVDYELSRTKSLLTEAKNDTRLALELAYPDISEDELIMGYINAINV